MWECRPVETTTVSIDREHGSSAYSFAMATGQTKLDVLQGTLDLMILQMLDVLGPLHGYGIARRIEQVSEDALQLNEGTVYASLL